MEVVNIGDKTSKLLSNTIAQIVKFYSKNEKIDCIYIRNYTIKNDLSRPVQDNTELKIRVSILHSEQLDKQELCKLDRIIKIIREKTGINLIIDFRDTHIYYIDMDDSRKYIACRDLYNSRIIFDRSGYFISLQQILSKYASELTMPNSTTIELEPKLKLKEKIKFK